MSNINFELNLNKHPKDVTNRSLVFAKNVQVSDDNSCLQSEYAILENRELKRLIGADTYIAGYIPCNKEFILFIAPGNWKQSISESNDKCIDIEIYRIREQGDLEGNYKGSYDLADGKLIYNQLKWYGGKIKGTFTYNIKSQLIIAFTEYDNENEILVPLKTINVGTWNSNTEDIFCDLSLTDDKLSLNPEIKIPSIEDFNYVNGSSYKGWYTFFIRYKLNEFDYTKWYHIGFPIFVDSIERVQLLEYFIQTRALIDMHGFGIIDYISSISEICDTTLELTIDNKNNDFQYYQIGCIISTKNNIRAFKTLDLKYDSEENNLNNSTFKFYLNIFTMEEYSSEELLRQQYNYYNVKNIINYKNRLYLSNYKENNFKDDINLEELANNFTININNDVININNLIPIEDDVYDIIIAVIDANGIPHYLYSEDGTNRYIRILDSNNYENPLDINIANFHCNGNLNLPLQRLDINLYKNGSIIHSVSETNLNLPIILDIDYTNNTNIHVEFIALLRQEENNNYNVWISRGTISTEYSYKDNTDAFYKNTYHKRLKNSTLIPGNYYKMYIHFMNKYGEYTNGIQLKNINSSNIVDIKDDKSFCIKRNYNTLNFNNNIYNLYNIEIISNIQSNNNFIGYFISYEKVQPIVKLTGYMVPYDFRHTLSEALVQGPGTKYMRNDYTKKPKNKIWRFYCADIDLYEHIDINFKYLILEEKLFTKPLENGDSNDYIVSLSSETQFNPIETNFRSNLNLVNKDHFCDAGQDKINIKSASIVLAHSFSKSNQFKGSYIELELENDDFSRDDQEVYIPNEYKVTLVSDDKNLYLIEDKTLIKLSDIINIDENKNIKYGYDGHLTYNNFLIYNNQQVILNSGYNILVNSEYQSYITSDVFEREGNPDESIKTNTVTPPMAYISMLIYSNKIYESKCFKTFPEIYPVRSESVTWGESKDSFTFYHNIIVLPQNSIDLFVDRFGIYDNIAPITYTNYTNKFITVFDKRIIRSNIIADESFENSWRGISTEAYKDITENKGNITNMIAIGTIFLVHTEHGLFMFDRNNTLKNGDGDTMQLSMPDVFDIDYQEVFTSDLGVCGLQDIDAWIIDEFGYIFYDNDAHKLYKFNSKKIAEIDGNICQFVNKYKPYKVRFANDCESNRLLVNIQYIDNINDNNLKEVTLSYNYRLNKWISFHDYCFDRAFFTKQMTYLIIDRIDENINYSNIYLINRFSYDQQHKITGFQNERVIRNITYNYFENTRDKHIYNSYNELHIMVNDSYEIMKTLEYITWKLYYIKRLNDNELDYTPDAREKIRHPYSGTTLRIYNDTCDTGNINIFVDENNFNKSVMNYNKPWWEFGNWNFNNLRDIKNKPLDGIGADLLSRLYGNYFIICIKFNSISNLSYLSRIEFETLDCKLINNPTI